MRDSERDSERYPLNIISEEKAELWARVSKLDWMTTDEAALYCRFGVSAFEKIVKSIPIPFSRPCGPKGDRRFFKSDLDVALRSKIENLPKAPGERSVRGGLNGSAPHEKDF